VCRDCFLELFEKRVVSAIEKFKMFAKEDKVLVAVSGGKDSLSLWKALDELGFKTTGLYINLGIGEYSEMSEEKVVNFAQKNGLYFKIVKVKDLLKKGIEELSRKIKRTPCRVCGTIKRYIMNKEAKDFFCVATGHNLDDEASLLLGNLLNWQKGYLERQFPVLDNHKSLRKKVKPFCFCLEQEISFYAFLKGIDYIQEECPLSKGATSLFYKKILNEIEEKMPTTKIRFYKQFLRQDFLKRKEEVNLKPCKNCGYLTVSEVCNFCKLREKVLAG